MEEKSVEALQAELEALKKENLERQIAAEKAKAEEAKRLEEAKEAEKLREDIRKEVMDELAQDSKIETTEKSKPEKLEGKSTKFQAFMNKYAELNGLKGKTYEDQIKEMSIRRDF